MDKVKIKINSDMSTYSQHRLKLEVDIDKAVDTFWKLIATDTLCEGEFTAYTLKKKVLIALAVSVTDPWLAGIAAEVFDVS